MSDAITLDVLSSSPVQLDVGDADPIAREEIAELTTRVTTVADVLTAAQGVTIGAVSYIQRGGVAALFIRASRSAATSGATTIGTLVTGKRPVMETAAPAPSGSGDVFVAADGTVNYRPSGTVAAGSNLYVRITYLVA